MALEFGMTSQEFWYDEPELFDSYYKFYKEKIKRQDYEEWKQGLYFSNAINVALYNAFKKANQKSETYMKEPLLTNVFKTKEQLERERQEKIKINLLSNVARLKKAIKEKKEK